MTSQVTMCSWHSGLRRQPSVKTYLMTCVNSNLLRSLRRTHRLRSMKTPQTFIKAIGVCAASVLLAPDLRVPKRIWKQVSKGPRPTTTGKHPIVSTK